MSQLQEGGGGAQRSQALTTLIPSSLWDPGPGGSKGSLGPRKEVAGCSGARVPGTEGTSRAGLPQSHVPHLKRRDWVVSRSPGPSRF